MLNSCYAYIVVVHDGIHLVSVFMKEKIIIKAPSYYMNNRKIYIQKLTELFRPYQKEILDNQENASCDQGAKTRDFDLLTHQVYL
mgnify:CR=1 FL=1